MAEYIDKQGIIDFLKVQMDTYFPEFCDYATGIKDSMYHIRQYPLSDVAPVKHGKWILEREPDGKPYCFHCSVCDDDFHHIGILTADNYCPNCGAKMDLWGDEICHD